MSDLRPIRFTSIATLHGMIFTCDYGFDVGNLHVIDYHLWLADLPIRRYVESPRSLRTSPADWSQ